MEPADAFFRDTGAPATLAQHTAALAAFVSAQLRAGRPLAVVTSGGTAVPLEKNTVRFVDNFSTGSRGAASAEHLLRAGYAVIFLHRDSSKQPFALPPLLELLAPSGGGGGGGFGVSDGAACAAIAEAKAAAEAGTLLKLPFWSVEEYLFLLRAACRAVAPARARALLLLAAAVSDFFVPAALMAEHKIQSKGGSEGLTVQLDGVPKMLGAARSDWAPEAFCASFKLETDASILLSKARGAIEKYGVHVVVANLLPTRYEEVTLVRGARHGEDGGEGQHGQGQLEVVSRAAGSVEQLEVVFIPRLAAMHEAHMAAEGA